MRKLILAFVLAAGVVTTVEASTTSMHASPATSQVGTSVTFTANFTTSCSAALTSHGFTIDGTAYKGTLVQTGSTGTETLSISTLGAGTHAVSYTWSNPPFCRGIASMSYTVTAAPSPTPSPSPSPSPSPIPSPTAVTLVATRSSDSALLGYVGAALIVLVFVAGAGLVVLGRR